MAAGGSREGAKSVPNKNATQNKQNFATLGPKQPIKVVRRKD